MLTEYPQFIDDLRSAFLSAPSAEQTRRHLADMLVVYEATRFLARDARRMRRAARMGTSVGLGAAIVAGASVAAASGALPDPIQALAAGVAEPFGVHLPAGRSDDAPGRGGENPGASDEAPGQQVQPGASENAPGHGGENPGRSETAPGHSDAENNKPETPQGAGAEHGNAPAEPPGQTDKPVPPGQADLGSATPQPNHAKGVGPQRSGRWTLGIRAEQPDLAGESPL